MADTRYRAYDHGPAPVTAIANDYRAGHFTHEHEHPYAQLIYAVSGVMIVRTEAGQWVVPPTRGIWMPPRTQHAVRMVGAVQMRSTFIDPALVPDLPTQCAVLAVSPLLRELIVAAVELKPPHAPGSRGEHLSQLLIDELRTLPSLALHLPEARDPRLKRICAHLLAEPADNSTATQWAQRLHVDAKTIQRLFARDTGMSFGQWRQQARLLAALERLARGERVLDTALALGYASPGAFATMFKRQFGVSPSAYFQ
ncbi:AraC family transcriptional regulator [Solimonas soli]|uniref:AraC family transcriptional regulator n=1 Tax=Solimonas soli TaxID=413479 RepID=UPI0004BC1109|nr:helix-turn-helix transcriptional regulator [Solimonas soli]